MHPKIFETFETVIRGLPEPQRVLEVGAGPSHATLLDIDAIRFATRRVAVGLDEKLHGWRADIETHIANANALGMFPEGAFDMVLCNSMLEHDSRFWLSVAELRRVTASQGHLVIGVPSFGRSGGRGRWLRALRSIGRLGLLPQHMVDPVDAAMASTPVLRYHGFPDDYYRFSQNAVQDVLLEGFDLVSCEEVLSPPRVVACGRKPGPLNSGTR